MPNRVAYPKTTLRVRNRKWGKKEAKRGKVTQRKLWIKRYHNEMTMAKKDVRSGPKIILIYTEAKLQRLAKHWSYTNYGLRCDHKTNISPNGNNSFVMIQLSILQRIPSVRVNFYCCVQSNQRSLAFKPRRSVRSTNRPVLTSQLCELRTI